VGLGSNLLRFHNRGRRTKFAYVAFGLPWALYIPWQILGATKCVIMFCLIYTKFSSDCMGFAALQRNPIPEKGREKKRESEGEEGGYNGEDGELEGQKEWRLRGVGVPFVCEGLEKTPGFDIHLQW